MIQVMVVEREVMVMVTVRLDVHCSQVGERGNGTGDGG